jgi:hypothetical protein
MPLKYNTLNTHPIEPAGSLAQRLWGVLLIPQVGGHSGASKVRKLVKLFNK